MYTFSNENKAVVGKFKDEAEGWIIIELIGEFYYFILIIVMVLI